MAVLCLQEPAGSLYAEQRGVFQYHVAFFRNDKQAVSSGYWYFCLYLAAYGTNVCLWTITTTQIRGTWKLLHLPTYNTPQNKICPFILKDRMKRKRLFLVESN